MGVGRQRHRGEPDSGGRVNLDLIASFGGNVISRRSAPISI